MIYIGLDVSKISTALCIEKNNETKLYSFTTKKDNNIWINKTKDYINYEYITYSYLKNENYSDIEILKLKEFDQVTNIIINIILDNVDLLETVNIGIEGYSYSSKGPIFDLIEFTTLLKHKIINKISNYSNINIISPLTLKTKTCMMCYEPRIEKKGKKVIKEIQHLENKNGKSATKFDKWDMLKAFIDSNLNLKFKEWCLENLDEINKNKEVPKPIDDIVDAIFLKEIMKINI